jgi:hypothetical protein
MTWMASTFPKKHAICWTDRLRSASLIFRRTVWIPYSRANKVLQQLEDLLNHPKCDRMPNLAISAQTNNGKTRLIKHFLSLHQASEASSSSIAAPVFYLQCPGIPDEARLYNSILLKLCKKFRPSAPPQEKLVLTLDALSKIDLRILALDEVNFTEVGTAAKQKRFLNALRFLANELRISIVCLGTEEMMRVIRTVPSVEYRFAPTVLPRWQPDKELRKLLASFEKIIPLKYPSDLQSSKLTSKLLTRSEGTIGELKMLLTVLLCGIQPLAKLTHDGEPHRNVEPVQIMLGLGI